MAAGTGRRAAAEGVTDAPIPTAQTAGLTFHCTLDGTSALQGPTDSLAWKTCSTLIRVHGSRRGGRRVRIRLAAEPRDRGRTLEQAKADKVLARYDQLGQGFVKTDAFVELIFRELERGAAPGGAKRP